MQTPIGVIGASGYSGRELVRLLQAHPYFGLGPVASRSLAGQALADHFPFLRPASGDRVFVASDPDELAQRDEVETFILALPHGVASEFALPLVESGKRVIDLSADFRLDSPAVYEASYGHPHPRPELLAQTPYVLPELSPAGWEAARLIACPGCYPTSVLIPLVPLVRAGLVDDSRIVISSMSGVSGAGKKENLFYSFCERYGSALAYGVSAHRHLSEMEEQLSKAAGRDLILQFTPHLVPIDRGIATTIVVPLGGPFQALADCLRETYADAPFVQLLEPGKQTETGRVVHGNCIEIGMTEDGRTGNLILTSAIDNLLKGASGQAVQILNRIYGRPETEGLL